MPLKHHQMKKAKQSIVNFVAVQTQVPQQNVLPAAQVLLQNVNKLAIII